jgi:hypothetical protein
MSGSFEWHILKCLHQVYLKRHRHLSSHWIADIQTLTYYLVESWCEKQWWNENKIKVKISSRPGESFELTRLWRNDAWLSSWFISRKAKLLMEVTARLIPTIPAGGWIQIFIKMELQWKIFGVPWNTDSMETRHDTKLWRKNVSRSKELGKLFGIKESSEYILWLKRWFGMVDIETKLKR